MSLSPALSVGSYTHQYHSQGYLVYQHQGQAAKVCAESLNTSLSQDQAQTFVRSLANTTCSHLQYDKMSWAAVTRDEEEAEVQYVGVSQTETSPGLLSLILSLQISALETGDTFPSVSCPSKLVLRMECEDLQCGRRPAASQEVTEGSDNRTVRHGDWPWHVSLFKSSSHVCDGTLVDTSWVISTKSCFQG